MENDSAEGHDEDPDEDDDDLFPPDDYDVLSKHEDLANKQDQSLLGGDGDDTDSSRTVAGRIGESLRIDGALVSKCLSSQNCVSRLADHLAAANETSSLTREEIEEEAALLLIRNLRDMTDKDLDLRGLDSEVSEAVRAVSAATPESDQAGQNHEILSGSELGEEKDDLTDDSDSPNQSENERDRDHSDRPDSAPLDSRALQGNSTGGDGQGDSEATVPAPVPRFLLKWKNGFRLTEQALVDRWERCQHPLGINDEVALVVDLNDGATTSQNSEESEDFIHFVKWTNAEKLQGRTVRIDADHRVVYSPAILFGKPVASKDFTSSVVLVTACGAASRKFQGHARDQLPKRVVRFAQLVGTNLGRILGVAGPQVVKLKTNELTRPEVPD